MRLLTDVEVRTYFGDPTPYIRPDGRVDPSWETATLATIDLPAPLRYGDTSIAVKTIRVHRRLAGIYDAAFTDLFLAGLFPAVGNLEGAYCWRMQRNARVLSRHCWAIAVDLDALHNPFLGLVPHVNPDVRAIMRRHGFAWGGATIWGGDFPWARRDPMHFEWAGDPASLPQ